MTKDLILKIAKEKDLKSFYEKYPSEEAFMKVHGKEFKKAQTGAAIDKAQFGKPLLPTDIDMPIDIPSNPNYGSAQQKASDLYEHSSQFDVIGDSLNSSELKSASKDLGGQSKMPGAQEMIGAATGLISAAGAFKEQKKKLQGLRQQRGVADLSLKAEESIDVDARRQQSENMAKQRQAQMPVNTGEEFFPIYGVGTNVLARNGAMLQDGGPVGGNPTEIQNTYSDEYDIYSDSGYEPLNDSNIKQYYHGGNIHQAQNGFSSFMGAGGTDFANKAVGKAFNNNAGYQMGSAVGNAVKMIPGVGPVVGAVAAPLLGAIGGGLDQAFGNAGKIKGEQRALDKSMAGIQNAGIAKSIQAQNQSYMKDGGWVSNDWTPQVIASFGGLDEQEVYDYAHEGMDSLRAGGHLRNYTPPSDRAMETYEDGGEIQSYGLGGELQTHWGGGAEVISRNPYLPGTGETVMFRGKSHEEYSPNGETGIGVTYGGNPVEVERGEPMVELEEGGTIDPETGEAQKSGVVFGNLKIPNQYIDILGDKNAKGKKFKNYVADLSKIEAKQNTIIDKSSKQLNALDPINSFDKLKLTALQANIQGANMKLKEIADKKINAASLQNAINDTAEENGLVADDLARGKVKIDKEANREYAKYGKQMFANGGMVDPLEELREMLKKKGFDYKQTSGVRKGAKTKQGKASRHSTGEAIDLTFPKLGKDSYNAMLNDPDIARFMLDNNLTAIDEYDDDIRKQTGGSGGHLHIGLDKGTAVSDKFRKDAQALYGIQTSATTTDTTTSAPTTTTKTTKPPRMTTSEAISKGFKYNPTTKQYEKTVKGVQATATETKSGEAMKDIPKGQSKKKDGTFGKVTPEQYEQFKKENSDWFDFTNFNPNNKGDVQYFQRRFNEESAKVGSSARIGVDDALGEQTVTARIKRNKQETPPADTIEVADVYEPETTTTEETTKDKFDWMSVLNSAIPYLRPSDAEELDAAQLYPEMFAMATNQVTPVQAQTFQPEIGIPYDISYQDQLNANQADYRAAQRTMGYNPAAQANLNAQKYQANQSVLANQFRANQEMKDKVYSENRNILNQAKLTNLGIFDKQYERQTEALANTKATTQAALNSISDKYAKNKLENRTLQTYENMYNYRFGPNFRAQNMNPLAQFDTDYKGASAEELEAMTALKKAQDKKEAAAAKKKPSLATESINRNGSIVKSYKNI